MNKNLLLGIVGTVVGIGGLKLYTRRIVKGVLKEVEDVLKEDREAYIEERRVRQSKRLRTNYCSRGVNERV